MEGENPGQDSMGLWAKIRRLHSELCPGAEVRTTKRISGNTVAPEERWRSISAWVADAMGRSGFLDSSKAFSKPTAMQRMTKSVGREWFMRRVGLMLEGSFF